MTIIPLPSEQILNLGSLPRGVGARYLECIRSHEGRLIAKRWRRKPPAKFDVLIDTEAAK